MMGDLHASQFERFVKKFTIGDECWQWTAGTNGEGYGAFYVGNGRGVELAHRVMHELFIGPIPEGHEVDHGCHNADLNCPGGASCLHRGCVRPDHLEAVTPTENNHRSALTNAGRTRCIHGHEFTPENTYLRKDGLGKRQCRRCGADRRKARTNA